MYCEYCGRNVKERCTCTRSTKISNIEIYSIFFFIMFITTSLFTYYVVKNDGIEHLNFIQIGSQSLAIVILVLWVISLISKRGYLAVFFGCHQRCNRSFKIKNTYFMICARCTGIAIGVFSLLVISYTIHIPLWISVLGIPLVIDGLLQHKTSYVSNNIKRLITGVLFGPTLIILFGGFYMLMINLVYNIMN